MIFFDRPDYLLSQLFGLAMFVADMIRFRQTSRQRILVWGFPAGIALIASQCFNDQWQGASMSTASMVSSLAQSPWNRNHWTHQGLRLALGVGFGAIGVWLSPPGAYWVTWLPLSGYLVGRVGELTHDFVRLRIVWLLSTSIFLAYHALMWNVMTTLTEAMVLSMSIRFLYREWRARKNPSASILATQENQP